MAIEAEISGVTGGMITIQSGGDTGSIIKNPPAVQVVHPAKAGSAILDHQFDLITLDIKNIKLDSFRDREKFARVLFSTRLELGSHICPVTPDAPFAKVSSLGSEKICSIGLISATFVFRKDKENKEENGGAITATVGSFPAPGSEDFNNFLNPLLRTSDVFAYLPVTQYLGTRVDFNLGEKNFLGGKAITQISTGVVNLDNGSKAQPALYFGTLLRKGNDPLFWLNLFLPAYATPTNTQPDRMIAGVLGIGGKKQGSRGDLTVDGVCRFDRDLDNPSTKVSCASYVMGRYLLPKNFQFIARVEGKVEHSAVPGSASITTGRGDLEAAFAWRPTFETLRPFFQVGAVGFIQPGDNPLRGALTVASGIQF